MTQHDYKQNAYYLLYLIRCVLNNKVPSKERIEKMDLSDLLYVANDHSLSAIAAYALNMAGIEDVGFEEEKNKSIRRIMILDAERSQIVQRLEKEGIWYMLLKGIYLKDHYPMIGMRQMCDNDILFDKTYKDRVNQIMLEMGFYNDHNDQGHDIVYFKEPVSNFEMHTELFGGGTVYQMNDIFEWIVKTRLIKNEGSEYGWHFTDEDFYLYLIAHEYKHYVLEGIGLRALVDTYVFWKRFGDELDKEYLSMQLEKLGIADFEKKNRRLAFNLIDGKPLGDEKEMLDSFIFAGSFGSFENRVKNKLESNNNSTARYLFSRLFIPNDMIKYNYPFFYKHRLLLPLLPIYRVIMGLAKSRRKLYSELKILKELKKK